jgi:hypothetical protein
MNEAPFNLAASPRVRLATPLSNHTTLRTLPRRAANQEQTTHVVYSLSPHVFLVVSLVVSSIGYLSPAPCNPILGARGPRYSVCT